MLIDPHTLLMLMNQASIASKAAQLSVRSGEAVKRRYSLQHTRECMATAPYVHSAVRMTEHRKHARELFLVHHRVYSIASARSVRITIIIKLFICTLFILRLAFVCFY